MTTDCSVLLNHKERPGEGLRRMRMRLGLATRKVAELSRMVAAQQGNEEYSISHARLVQIENEDSSPSLFKLFTLSTVYGVPIQKLLSMYLNLDAAEPLHTAMALPHTHIAAFDGFARKTIPFPVNLSSTSGGSENEVRPHLTQAWDEVPVPLLEHLKQPQARYGLIGLSDYRMSPLIRPGSVVQLAECHRVARPVPYRTDWDRPIYFLESRAGYLCSWCDISGGQLFSIPHPLSPCQTQAFAFPSEVDVIGRVTGVALRLEHETFRGELKRGSMDVIDGDCSNRERATAG